ncbi:hypothetical protein F383_26848 [Gossypium arboreum]|uniref:Uncharacterized protein n=1 Tax=Gossypium arboreum TaxID=29729 RepID=A0A0B0PGD9_GOSAR|nr:hypothetical protein F383_26848 [Gossypium arboreum]
MRHRTRRRRHRRIRWPEV